MVRDPGGFGGRKAPYAPISSLARFFDRIRDRQVPEMVDHNFLSRLNVAHNNEYALLSALKFLGVVSDGGRPTTAYRSLQTTHEFKDTLWGLVQLSYKPVFEAGAETFDLDDLVNFFRVSSSPSQAKNAARFFRAVCELAGHTPWAGPTPAVYEPSSRTAHSRLETASEPGEGRVTSAALAPLPPISALAAKADLLSKLPAPHPDWPAETYLDICNRFLEMLRHLDEADPHGSGGSHTR